MSQNNNNKYSQEEVTLREAREGSDERCGNCTSYRGDGKCTDVEGEVDSDDICDIFTPVDPTSTAGQGRS